VAQNAGGTVYGLDRTFRTAAPGTCTYTIDPVHASYPALGGSGTVGVTTASGCTWTAASHAGWIAPTSGIPGSGPGSVGYSVSANPGPAGTGTMTVAGLTHTVEQAGCVANVSGDADGDQIPDPVELSERTSPCVKDNDIFTRARLFAMQQYRDFLRREGEESGIGYWVSQIDGGAQTRAQAVKSFFDSVEFQGAIAPVTRLYFAYFLRIPDKPGLEYWIAAYRAGMTLEQISEQFATSPEFTGRYGALTNAEFVTLVYQNVLGRAPDAYGLAYWVSLLDSGAMTRGAVMLGFSESDEYKAVSYNRVYVTMIYYGMLRRVPEQAGFDYWVAYLNGGASALDLINAFLVAIEYHWRFLP
jgi:hypothetical protein